MTRTLICKKSKKGNLYLVSVKDGKTTFVNLVKGEKGNMTSYYPDNLVEGAEYQVAFTGYRNDEEDRKVTLFGVSGI
jgi:hypothetical protein